MFRNYLKISWRNLARNPGYSFINIGGLALGMSIAILIGLWLYDELTYNRYHDNYDRVVQIMQHQTVDGNISSQVAMPIPLGNALREDYGSDFTHIALSSWVWNHVVSFNDRRITQTGAFVEESFPEMMTFKMVSGSRTALEDPSSILLSESMANALFGDDEPLDKTIQLDNKLDVKVAGIYKDLPDNSTFNDLRFIASWKLYITSEEWLKVAAGQWYNNSFQLFAQLAPHSSPESVSAKIKDIKMKYSPEVRAYKPEVYAYPMKDWYLRAKWKNGVNDGGRIDMVWLFGAIGVFVLLLACINFMNLSTARSEKRAKEVGIRMSIGSVRVQLIKQFLTESFLVVLLAFVATVGLVVISLPAFNLLADKRIEVPWTNPGIWLISVTFITVTSLLAGSYPALYLSSFHPAKVLKGAYKAGKAASLPRKVLVVLQFTVSVTLVIGTIIVYQQIQFSRSRPAGYSREGLIMVPMSTPDFYGKYDILRSELQGTGVVDEMAESSSSMGYVGSNSGGFSWQGKDPNLQLSDFGTIWVTPEYGKTIGWNIKAGRDFSREFSTDSTAVILNEAAVKYMGVKSPVGMELVWGEEKFHVIGVCEDIIMESPYKAVRPNVHFLNSDNAGWILIKLSPSSPVSESVSKVESVFKRNFPTVPFEYKFTDDVYAKKFNAEERIGKLSYVFATLAIVISCLGLFGLASFVAEQRTKEIGIRKVLGATVAGLWKMLSKDFVMLVTIACSVAVPLATFILADWLKGYEYHTEISWWIPVTTVFGALVVTLATVSFQALRSARMNPVKSLRSE